MASFRVHEDHEKRGFSDLRQKQANMAPLQQKRSVLATLQNQASRQIQPKGKQVQHNFLYFLLFINKFCINPKMFFSP